MAEISIPGISNKYKTNDYIDALMQKERIPLNREQESLDRYKEQQSAWRGMNQKMSSLRESTKTLYSFENPFNNKITSSSDEQAITADAARDAAYGTIKIDVIKEATADRFLSAEMDRNSQVPKGTYTFQVADKTITFNWKGGKLTDFVNSLNKRGGNTVKASLVSVSSSKSALLIESLKTGSENNLVFLDDALVFALENKIIEKSAEHVSEFGTKHSELMTPEPERYKPEIEQDGMPEFSAETVAIDEENKRIQVPSRGGFAVSIAPELLESDGERIEFSFSLADTDDITDSLNIQRTTRPELPEAGTVTFDEITVANEQSETTLPPVPQEPLVPISGAADFFVRNKDGSEIRIDTDNTSTSSRTGEKTISLALKEYPDIESIVVRNRNTGTQLLISYFSAFDEKQNLGFVPVNPVSVSGDAVIKYEGITITRPDNKIDDVIPHITLTVKQPTEKTASIEIAPDKEAAKDALIEFVGKYNQVISEINILSEGKPEIIAELEYMSEAEQEAAAERLGMFRGDFSLANGKSALRSIVTASYKWSESAVLTMLNQIGISSRASGNNGGVYTAGQMRGYLEIDEKKLDSALDEHLDEIKNLFGYDSDGDLVIDSGIGFALDKQLTSWVQSGGIIATKNNGLNTKIKASENNIRQLEAKLSSRESQLRNKYGQMEGTLNSLNAQADSISNFANSGKE